MLDERRLASQLQGEGFSHTYFWADGPNTKYPDHAHISETAHVILSGEMTLTIEGESHLYRAGDRCDVPAGVPRRTPLVSPGGNGSNGIPFLLQVRPACSNADSAALPVKPLDRKSSNTKCVSVPPVTRS